MTDSSLADGIGSILIGVLLCGTGVALARYTHSLLIGESATRCADKRSSVGETPGVLAMTQLLAMHLDPDAPGLDS